MSKLNIIISHTDTFVARMIRLFTKSYYNHCSIALDGDFSHLYSFSRKHKKLWFTGCFTEENLNTLSCSDGLKVRVFEIPITQQEYLNIGTYLSHLLEGYKAYNYLGIVLIIFNTNIKSTKHHLCSTFVAYILSQVNSIKLEKEFYLYKPKDILKLMEDNKCKEINI